jgi:hypothetical protein
MKQSQVSLSLIWAGPLLFLVACTSAPKTSEDQVSKRLSPKESHSSATSTFQTVEAKLKHTKGNQVLISKELLEKLLEEQKATEQARVRLSGQLEALKKVDREEPQKFVQ